MMKAANAANKAMFERRTRTSHNIDIEGADGIDGADARRERPEEPDTSQDGGKSAENVASFASLLCLATALAQSSNL